MKTILSAFPCLSRELHSKKKPEKISCISFSALLVFLLFSVCYASPEIIFTKIADTSTSIPEGSGTFSSLRTPFIDGKNVAFKGNHGTEQEGIFISTNRVLSKVAMRGDYIPDAYCVNPNIQLQFLDVSFLSSLCGTNLCFRGFGYYSSKCSRGGLYANLGATLSVLVDQNSDVPGRDGTFSAFANPWMDGEDVAFYAEYYIGYDLHRGIFKKVAGTLYLVADDLTQVPGKSYTFCTFGGGLSLNCPRLDNGSVVFIGDSPCSESTNSGVYTDLGGTLQVVADTNTLMPGSSSTFSSFYGFNIKDGVIVFVGNDGIYKYTDGVITKEVQPGECVTDSDICLNSMFSPSIDGDILAFKAKWAHHADGIFAKIGEEIIEVIKDGDILDGSPVSINDSQGEAVSVSGNNIVFDSSNSIIYVATLPETLINETFEPGQDIEEDLGFSVEADPNTGVAEIIIDPEDSNNGVLRLFDPGDNSVSITKNLQIQDLFGVLFRYKFNTDGKLDIILRDPSSCVVAGSCFPPFWKRFDRIIAPQSGPGRDTFTEYTPYTQPCFALVATCLFPTTITLELSLSGQGDPEIFLDDLEVTTTGSYPEPLPLGDINRDRRVDGKDFAILANNWFDEEPEVDIAPPPFGDELMNVIDLATLTANWLEESLFD